MDPKVVKEVEYRNNILIHLYGRIPSYALWDYSSVGNESKKERLEWWEDIKKEQRDNLNKCEEFSTLVKGYVDE